MRRRTSFLVALLAVVLSAPDASAQQAPIASDAAALDGAPTKAARLDAAPTAEAPLLRVTGLSPSLLPAVRTPTAADASARWETGGAGMTAAGSKAQFKLWCLGLFLGGAAVYWAGDQAGIDILASTGAFISLAGLLGLIMPTW